MNDHNEELDADGIKLINIHAKTNYPIVSAYEFESLKTEEEVKALIKPCTIYFILQRPLLYMKNLFINGNLITFEITDDTDNPPLECFIDVSLNKFLAKHDHLNITIGFYKKEADTEQPFNDVAAIKIYDPMDNFIAWYTPQKIIYEYLSGSLKAIINGDIRKYIDYTVHYIGKSFSQKIWNRLTGHHKLQKALTLELPMNNKSPTSSFEISLLLLDIDGFDEFNVFPYFDNSFPLNEGITPIIHKINNASDFSDFFTKPLLDTNAEELTNEVEAFLINCFKPDTYNEVLMESYPNIKRGTRSAGYTQATLFIDKMPAILKTKYHTQDIVLPSHA